MPGKNPLEVFGSGGDDSGLNVTLCADQGGPSLPPSLTTGLPIAPMPYIDAGILTGGWQDKSTFSEVTKTGYPGGITTLEKVSASDVIIETTLQQQNSTTLPLIYGTKFSPKGLAPLRPGSSLRRQFVFVSQHQDDVPEYLWIPVGIIRRNGDISRDDENIVEGPVRVKGKVTTQVIDGVTYRAAAFLINQHGIEPVLDPEGA